MYKTPLYLVLSILIICCLFSCVDTRKSTYFNNAADASFIENSADTILPLIQKNDLLGITITSLSSDASALFNITNNFNGSTVTSTTNNQTGAGYLVGSDGTIQLPILGSINVVGFTSKVIKERITEILLDKKLLKDPIVTIRQLNYEVTVLGEVGRPTVINVPSEKISLLKALGLAGDITIYGKKENVLLVRENNGKRLIKRINLNAPSFLTSPFYYLQPNDVVYVEANKDKIASTNNFKQTLPIILSGISVIILALDRVIKR